MDPFGTHAVFENMGKFNFKVFKTSNNRTL